MGTNQSIENKRYSISASNTSSFIATQSVHSSSSLPSNNSKAFGGISRQTSSNSSKGAFNTYPAPSAHPTKKSSFAFGSFSEDEFCRTDGKVLGLIPDHIKDKKRMVRKQQQLYLQKQIQFSTFVLPEHFFNGNKRKSIAPQLLGTSDCTIDSPTSRTQLKWLLVGAPHSAKTTLKNQMFHLMNIVKERKSNNIMEPIPEQYFEGKIILEDKMSYLSCLIWNSVHFLLFLLELVQQNIFCRQNNDEPFSHPKYISDFKTWVPYLLDAQALVTLMEEENYSILHQILCKIEYIWRSETLLQEMYLLWNLHLTTSIEFKKLQLNATLLQYWNECSEFCVELIESISTEHKNLFLDNSPYSFENMLKPCRHTVGIFEDTNSYFGNRVKMFELGSDTVKDALEWSSKMLEHVNISGIVFCVSLRDVLEASYEPNCHKKLDTTLHYFEKLVNSTFCKSTPVYLIFSGKDIFAKNISVHDMITLLNESMASDADISQEEFVTHKTGLLQISSPSFSSNKTNQRKLEVLLQSLTESDSTTIEQVISQSKLPKANSDQSLSSQSYSHGRSSSSNNSTNDLVLLPSLLDRTRKRTVSDSEEYTKRINHGNSLLTSDSSFTSTNTSFSPKKGLQISDMSTDILTRICQFLQASDLALVQRVCYKLYCVAGADSLWKQLCLCLNPHNQSLLQETYLEEEYDKYLATIALHSVSTDQLSSFALDDVASEITDSTNTAETVNNRFSVASDISWVSTEEAAQMAHQIMNFRRIGKTPTVHHHSSRASPLLNSYSNREIRKKKWKYCFELGGLLYYKSLECIKQKFLDCVADEGRKNQIKASIKVCCTLKSRQVKSILDSIFIHNLSHVNS